MNTEVLIQDGARASTRFYAGEPVDFRLTLGPRVLKRRERLAPLTVSAVALRKLPIEFSEPTAVPVTVSLIRPSVK